jgi:purine-binding chemotaxis protein CheW
VTEVTRQSKPAEAVVNRTRMAEAGKYLTFQLGSTFYGLEILKVQEIIGLMAITSMPKMPDYVRGVINLRGSVIPVIDLRRRFGMEDTEDTERTCVIVVQVGRNGTKTTFGIVIDEVSEVLDITGTQIEPAPHLGTEAEMAYLIGIGKIGQRVVMLLDVDEVLATVEKSKLVN